MSEAARTPPDPYHGEGGSYTIDPETGARRLVARTRPAPPPAPPPAAAPARPARRSNKEGD